MFRLSTFSKFLLLPLVLALVAGVAGGTSARLNAQQRSQNDSQADGDLASFLGEPEFQVDTLFDDERFPNVVTTRDGAVIATWGSRHLRARRSEDGGESWSPEIRIGDGIHGGGLLVDEQTGDVIFFAHPEHPPRDGQSAPRSVYRSRDQGKTWMTSDATFAADSNGYLPSLHMMEHGTTLSRGAHSGRLIRPARVYRRSPDRYCLTIFSDDRGESWKCGEPFPVKGTGEAAVVELSDGRLLASARRSFFPEGEPFEHGRLFGLSDDGGHSWHDTYVSSSVPDGPRYRGATRRGSNYNGHFGLFAGLCRLPVKDRDIIITSNADQEDHQRARLAVWASFDGGRSWPIKRLVHEGPAAYSSLIAGRPETPSEGNIYLQFEYGEENRQYVGCKLARFNLSWLLQGTPTGDGTIPTP